MTHDEAIRITQSIVHVSRKSGALPTDDARKVGRAIRLACAHWHVEARGLVTPPMRGAAPWTEAEMNVFRLGRALSQVMHKLGVWRGRGAVLNAAASVLTAAEHGRGRQTFAQLLGEYGAGQYGAELSEVIEDRHIGGYAVKALLAGKHGEYVERVRPLASPLARDVLPWVRIAARRYVDAFGPPPRARSRSGASRALRPDHARRVAGAGVTGERFVQRRVVERT